MKFVFFGYDFMIGAVHRLIADGYDLRGIFTFECDNVFTYNRELAALGALRNIPLSFNQPSSADIDFFIGQGCTAFLCAGYIYKIPPIDERRAYGINVHPSYLPQGRGLMPTPSILMHHPEAAGFTIHKLNARFDAGDILYQQRFEIDALETVETLSARTALAVPEQISRLFADLPAAWKRAVPQDEARASIFTAPDEAMRTLDWAAGIEQVLRTARAFGRYGSLARFDNALWIVYALDGWRESHSYQPGDLVARLSREIIITTRDGFAVLKEFQKL